MKKFFTYLILLILLTAIGYLANRFLPDMLNHWIENHPQSQVLNGNGIPIDPLEKAQVTVLPNTEADPTPDPILLKPNGLTLRPGGYFLYQCINFNKGQDGFNGRLELWLDKNITNQPDFISMSYFVTTASYGKPADKKKFKNAILTLLDEKGENLKKLELIWPVAKFRRKLDLYGDGRPVVQVDQLTLSDSYSITDTDLVEVKQNQLIDLPISLTQDEDYHFHRSQMWKLVPAKSGKGQDILISETSLENYDKDDVDATYTRYFFDGNKWKKNERKAKFMGEWSQYDSGIDESTFP